MKRSEALELHRSATRSVVNILQLAAHGQIIDKLPTC